MMYNVGSSFRVREKTVTTMITTRATRASDVARLRADQERRRSNAARPIPGGKHKTPRATARQALRQEMRAL